MEALRQRILSHPYYDKALYWGKLISITGSAQVIVQAVGFLCGILVIRLLPTQEYALYTLANTMLGTMTVLADGGISSGVMAQGGKVWQDREKLGVVLATGLDLRRKFAIGSLIVSTPILLYLLLHNGASWITAVLIVLSLIPAFFASLSDSLLQIAPKLHQIIIPLQKNQVTVGIGRLILSALTLFVFPWTFVAILASGIPRIYGNIQLKRISQGFVDPSKKTDPIVQKQILSLVKRMLPEIIYYCLSGQLNVWLISIFGSTLALASLGALGRLGMALSLFSVLFSTLIVPRFARLPNVKEVLLKKVLSIFAISIILSFVFVCVTWICSEQLLWILGPKYSNLRIELVLSITGGCVSLILGYFFSINTSRGWAINPIMYIFISFLTSVISYMLVDVSSLRGVIIFNLIISATQAFTLICYCYYKILTLKNENYI